MTITTTPKLAAAAAAVTLLLGSAAAVAATGHTAAATKGTVYVWVTHSPGPRNKILLTGVIGDHGTSTSTTKSGKPTSHGGYVQIHLQNGTFSVNAVAFNKKLNAAQPNFDKATCTAWEVGSGHVTLYNGTGAYAGISGTIRITNSFALLFPKHTSGPKKGHCEFGNNVRPISVYNGSVTGSGHISFG